MLRIRHFVVLGSKAFFAEADLGVMKRVNEELIGERLACSGPVLLRLFQDWLRVELLYFNSLLNLL